MKSLFFIATLLLATTIQAQLPATVALPVVEILPAYPIRVTVHKTANLVFPYEVKSVDRGTEDLLVQKVLGAGHILQVKAATTGMSETNLSVVTADMHLYSFLVRFDSFPETLNYRFSIPHSPAFIMIRPGNEQLNDAQVQQDAAQVAGYPPFGKRVEAYRDGIALRLNGVYIHEDVLYFSLQLENGASIRYDIETLRFFIRDRQRGKRTAEQEVDIPQRYHYGDTALIEAHTGQRLVVAVPKFTIPDKKDCILQLREANGGRHLELTIRNKLLIRCRTLADQAGRDISGIHPSPQKKNYDTGK